MKKQTFIYGIIFTLLNAGRASHVDDSLVLCNLLLCASIYSQIIESDVKVRVSIP